MFETEFLVAVGALLAVSISVVKSNHFWWLMSLLLTTTFVLSPIMLLGLSFGGGSSPNAPPDNLENILTGGMFLYLSISALAGVISIIASSWYRWYMKVDKANTILRYALAVTLPWLMVVTFFMF